jgi:hypothetical protein
MVPGEPLAAWAGPDGSSLSIYRALPDPDGSAEALVTGLANRLDNLPGVQIRERTTEAVAGTTAARVELVGPGTGDALAASGTGTPVAPDDTELVPTRQVTLGFIRPSGTLYLSWHLPESSYERIAPEIRATVKSLRLAASGMQAAYSYSH